VLYVTDESRKLIGVISLGDLVSAESDTIVGEIMTKDVRSVKTDTDQEEVARLLKDLDLLAVPVVDSEERLVGIGTVDDAIDILEEEASEDMLKKTGIGSFLYRREEGRSSKLIYGTLWHVWRVRLPFLVITLIGGLLAGVVIEAFEETLEAVVALAIFIPGRRVVFVYNNYHSYSAWLPGSILINSYRP
jgi:magnesium transporter